MITYYLFGKQATDSYFETGSIDQIVSDEIEFGLHKHDNLADPTGAELIQAADGWEGAADITEDEHETLKNLNNDC